MKRIIMASITAVIVIVVLAGVLIPTLNDSTSSTLTYTNKGVLFALADAEDADTHTIVVDSTGLTSDGDTIDASPYLSGDYTIVFGEHSIIRYSPSTGRVDLGGTVAEGTTQQFTTIRSASSEETLTLTITGETMVTVNGETTKTIEDNWAYVSNDGTYSYCVNPCVTPTDRIIGGGVTYSPFSGATVICFDGTIEGITAGIYRSSPTATLTDTEVVTSNVTTNLYKIDAIKFTATQSDTERVATYTYFLAPAEVTYENPAYVGSSGSAILAAIPALVIVALILGVVALVLRSRMD